MDAGLEIRLDVEQLDEGSPEERAGFGMFSIRSGNTALTEGFDHFVRALRPGPMVSGYHAAEWFAWNWWRLRYEPYSPRSVDWWRAHRMNAIGEGYVWPRITFRTDGVRAAIISEPSSRPDAKPFRFVGASTWEGPVSVLEDALRDFFLMMSHRLSEQGIPDSNLHRIIADNTIDKLADMAERRRLEALLGFDPDEADETVIQALLDDSCQLGMMAIDELAAGAMGGPVPRAETLRNLASSVGSEVRRPDAVRLSRDDLTVARNYPIAWRQGRHAAQALRRQEGLGAAPIGGPRLARLLGTTTDAPNKSGAISPLSYVLDQDSKPARLVLRSRWDTGRRFEMARLLGDHLLFGEGATMLPATGSYTFRQKSQRSFAAEFLCPLDAVTDMLQGDFSSEAIEDVAEHFAVSTLTVETLLRNNGLIERELVTDTA